MSLVIASVGIISVACSSGSNSSKTLIGSHIPSSVVTTLYPLEYFAQRIGGEEVSVVNLVKPGVEAHSFEPSPEDIRKLPSLSASQRIRLGLDRIRINMLLEANPNRLTPSAVINLQKVFLGNEIPGTRVLLVDVQAHGIAVESLETRKLFYIRQ